MKTAFPILAVLVLTCANASAAPASQKNFKRFMSYWAGDYDNLAQVKSQTDLPEEQRNAAYRLYIRRVELPAFGRNVYYAEWRDAYDATKIIRQRIYAFDLDPVSSKIELVLNIFPDNDPALRDRTAGAFTHPERLAGLTPADMSGLKGCNLLFEPSSGGFLGAMKKGACSFPAPETGTPIYSWSQMKITTNAFAYLDGWFNLDGTVYKKRQGDWSRLQKVLQRD